MSNWDAFQGLMRSRINTQELTEEENKTFLKKDILSQLEAVLTSEHKSLPRRQVRKEPGDGSGQSLK